MTRFERLTALLVRNRYSALTVLCALLYLPNLGGYRLFDVDEPRYAATAQRMVQSGDWCVPYFNGEYRFEKPVLTYWLIGGAIVLLGDGEAAARFPAAACATGTVLLTCLLGTRLLAPGAGLAAGMALALSLQFLALGRMALTDMPLTFFFSACLALFLLADREPDRKRARLHWLGAFLACGLAVLTKGPVGLVLPAAIVGVYWLAAGRLRQGLKSVPWISGTLLFLAVCLPWYLLVNLRSDWEFFRVFIIRHNIQRFAGEVAPGGQHVEPFWYYLPLLVAGAWPWSFFSLQAIASPIRQFLRSTRAERTAQPMLFPLVWCLGVVLFFSVARAKLPTYITPAFPPLMLLLAAYWQALYVKGRMGAALKAPAWIGAILSAGAGVFLIVRAGSLGGSVPSWLPMPAAAVFAAGSLLALLFVLRRKPVAALFGQALGQISLALFLALAALPAVSALRQQPQVELIECARQYSGPAEVNLAAYRYRKTALVYYSGQTVTFVEPGQCARLDSLARPLTVLTRSRYLAELQDSLPGLELIARSADLVLLGKK
ncbi:glycosyltransferase family 39 protein [bacterium]|nr:glycosyltransferase family 39 protein [bacterium]